MIFVLPFFTSIIAISADMLIDKTDKTNIVHKIICKIILTRGTLKSIVGFVMGLLLEELTVFVALIT